MSEELIYINGSYQRPNSVKKEVSKAVKELVGLAPEEFDTMQELAEAVQENTEALKNVKIEAKAPLEFKDGKIQLNYSDSLKLYQGKQLSLNPATNQTLSLGGVMIGTGYISSFPSFYYKHRSKSILLSGIHSNDSGTIGLLPPNIEGYNNKSTLGGILSAKIHTTTPDIKEVTSGNYYRIETDELGNAFVRIPESSGSVDTATTEKAGIVKLGTGTIHGETIPVSTDMYGGLALAIGSGLYNFNGILDIKAADRSNYGVVQLGMSSFSESKKQPVGEGQFSTGNGLGFPIGTGLNSKNDILYVSIGTGLILNNEDLNVGLDENLFEWNPSTKKISIKIDNLKTQLGL